MSRVPFPCLSGVVLTLLAGGCISFGEPPAPLPEFIPATRSVQPKADLRVEIHSPQRDTALAGWESAVEVTGGASVFGGVRHIELMLAIDTSKSLRRMDPRDYRVAGAMGLVKSLPEETAIRVGLVDFDSKAKLVSALTSERSKVLAAIRRLDRDGTTNLAAGIRTALRELERGARPDSTKVVLLFTDGKSNQDKARRAMEEARAQGVVVHTMLLGSDRKGASILAQIAAGTGGSFVHVTDPAKLPEAFLDLRTTGIESVSLRVNDSAPIATRLVGGTFSGRVPLSPGVNRISAIAKSLTGETREDVVTVAVSGPLALEIDSPGEGTLLSNEGRGNLVEGRVNAFASLRGAHQFDLTGLDVREVVLETGDGAEVVAQVANGRFSGRVRLREGTNQIRAIATTVDGRTARDSVTVEVQARGCAQLEAVAYRDSQPALSLSDRSVEIVLDGSNSMWGRMGGRPKIAVAREILLDALDWLPRDVQLGFRAYGHRRPRKARDCQDSELLVPFGSKNRDQIRHAIAGMKPKGQTPLAYSLAQLQSDFGARGGERAVVLVTDGIESCGGDPRQEALALGRANTPVHVIGFGLGSAGDEDLSSLRAIASSSGGRFLLARSAEELRGALAETVGTPFQVSREGRVVARGALGSGERLRLPEGRYLVELESEPAQQVRVTLTSNQGLTLAWERKGETITHSEKRRVVDYEPCSALPESLPASPR